MYASTTSKGNAALLRAPCVFRGGEGTVIHKLVIQVHHASTTHNFSSAEYGIKIGIVTKAHDKLGKPGDLEHEDVLGRKKEERKKRRKKEIREE